MTTCCVRQLTLNDCIFVSCRRPAFLGVWLMPSSSPSSSSDVSISTTSTGFELVTSSISSASESEFESKLLCWDADVDGWLPTSYDSDELLICDSSLISVEHDISNCMKREKAVVVHCFQGPIKLFFSKSLWNDHESWKCFALFYSLSILQVMTKLIIANNKYLSLWILKHSRLVVDLKVT